jgi:hypothetical protein
MSFSVKPTTQQLIYLLLAQGALLLMVRDFPAFDLPLGSASKEPTIKSSKPSPLTSPAVETEKPLLSYAFSPLITKPRRKCR